MAATLVRLIASVIVRNEAHRYLRESLTALQGFCDEVCVWDDGSTDETRDVLRETGVRWSGSYETTFYANEGLTRQKLLKWTLQHEPTHIIAIDADEFVAEPRLIHTRINLDDEFLWTLTMREVWHADESELHIRCDGEWEPHEVPILWKVPKEMDGDWRIPARKLASGRIPAVLSGVVRPTATDSDVLHFGWTRRDERENRYSRYAEHDGGNFHEGGHLKSILWPDILVQTEEMDWPTPLEKVKERILRYAS